MRIPWNKGTKGIVVAWNKGLKLSTMPKYSGMGFQKGNKLADNSESKSTQFKKGERVSPTTEFQKGYASWNKGNEGFLSGEKHWKWIKDRTQLVKNENKHLDGCYREWMFSVKTRDSWKCRISNLDCSGRLEAHHILNWKDYPELRYKINNGITLCHAHHPRGREEEKRLSPYFQDLVSVSKV